MCGCAMCVRVETGLLGRDNGMRKGLEEAEGKSEALGTGGGRVLGLMRTIGRRNLRDGSEVWRGQNTGMGL